MLALEAHHARLPLVPLTQISLARRLFLCRLCRCFALIHRRQIGKPQLVVRISDSVCPLLLIMHLTRRISHLARAIEVLDVPDDLLGAHVALVGRTASSTIRCAVSMSPRLTASR